MRACEKCGHVPEQKPTGWIVEGEWSGYRSFQRRVVHREYVRDVKFAEKVRALGSISYTDGTALYLSVRPHRGRRAEPEIHGYDSLIRQCVDQNVRSVAELRKTASDSERSARASDAQMDHAADVQTGRLNAALDGSDPC